MPNAGPPPPGFPGAFPPPNAAAPAPGASGPQATKRRPPGSPRRFGVLALVLAALTAIALLAVLTSTAEPSTTYVLRTSRDLSPAANVTDGDLTAVALPKEAVEAGAITGSSAAQVLDLAKGVLLGPDDADWQVVGKRPRYPLLTGQQLRPQMFTSPGGAASQTISDEERLVSVRVSAANALIGGLGVGDRVDVAVAGDDIAGLVAENVEIVAVQSSEDVIRSAQQAQGSSTDLSANDLLPATPIPGTYVLRVPKDRVMSLVVADSTGGLYLIGRTAQGGTTPNAATNLTRAICSSPSSAASPLCAGS